MKKTLLRTRAALMVMFFMSMSTSLSLIANGDDPLCEEPDHFIAYPIENPSPFGEVTDIGLVDEFLPPTAIATPFLPLTFAIIEPAIRLFNPATKRAKEKKFVPQNPNTHYVEYDLLPVNNPFTFPGPGQVATARVFNQFQSFDITVSTVVGVGSFEPFSSTLTVPRMTLLVPTIKHACDGSNCTLESEKSCSDCPPKGDHFVCYLFTEAFRDANAIIVDARFSDQFQNNRRVDHLLPVAFCNPVEKTVNGNVSPANNVQTNHLVCYDACDKFLNPPIFVNWFNQFELPGSGVVENDDRICVPSVKIPTGFNDNGGL